MTKDQVAAYVQTEVTRLADARVKPLIQSINTELAQQRENDRQKAELDKLNSESNERIVKLQAALGQANKEVNDLAVKLAEATTAAANTGETTGAPVA